MTVYELITQMNSYMQALGEARVWEIKQLNTKAKATANIEQLVIAASTAEQAKAEQESLSTKSASRTDLASKAVAMFHCRRQSNPQWLHLLG